MRGFSNILVRYRGKIVLWFFCSMVGVSACSGGGVDVPTVQDKGEQNNKPTPPKKGKSIDKEKIKEKGDVAFSADDLKRDPFLPKFEHFQSGGSVVEQKERQTPNTPLERYPIDSYTVAVIISDVAIPKAMVIDQKGDGHVVRQGTKIGREGYQVAQIRDSSIEMKPAEGSGGDRRTLNLRTKAESQFQATGTSDTQQDLTREEREALERLRAQEGDDNENEQRTRKELEAELEGD